MIEDASLELDAEIEFKIPKEAGETLMDALKKSLESNPEMAPHIIIFDQPYAIYQEFGTGPCKSGLHHVRAPGHKRRSKSRPMSCDTFGHTETQKRFIEWAKHKSNGRNTMKLARTAYHAVMQRGLNPNNVVTEEYAGFHPFARPAFYEISALSRTPGAYSSIAEIAEAMRDRALQIMTDNDWVASGLLKDSVDCRPLTMEEIIERGLEGDLNENQQ